MSEIIVDAHEANYSFSWKCLKDQSVSKRQQEILNRRNKLQERKPTSNLLTIIKCSGSEILLQFFPGEHELFILEVILSRKILSTLILFNEQIGRAHV